MALYHKHVKIDKTPYNELQHLWSQYICFDDK